MVFYGGFISSNQALDYVKIEFPPEKHTAKLEVNVKLSAQMVYMNKQLWKFVLKNDINFL